MLALQLVMSASGTPLERNCHAVKIPTATAVPSDSSHPWFFSMCVNSAIGVCLKNSASDLISDLLPERVSF